MKKTIALGLAALALCGSASAASFYGQAGVTRVTTSLDCSGQDYCGNSGRGWGGRMGLRFDGGWAVELGAMAITNIEHRKTAADTHQDIDGIAYGFGMAHHSNLSDRWTLSWRLGVANVRTETDGDFLFAPSAKSEHKLSPYAGVAFGYRFNRVLSLQMGLEHTRMPVRYDNHVQEVAPLTTVGVSLGFNY